MPSPSHPRKHPGKTTWSQSTLEKKQYTFIWHPWGHWVTQQHNGHSPTLNLAYNAVIGLSAPSRCQMLTLGKLWFIFLTTRPKSWCSALLGKKEKFILMGTECILTRTAPQRHKGRGRLIYLSENYLKKRASTATPCHQQNSTYSSTAVQPPVTVQLRRGRIWGRRAWWRRTAVTRATPLQQSGRGKKNLLGDHEPEDVTKLRGIPGEKTAKASGIPPWHRRQRLPPFRVKYITTVIRPPLPGKTSLPKWSDWLRKNWE